MYVSNDICYYKTLIFKLNIHSSVQKQRNSCSCTGNEFYFGTCKHKIQSEKEYKTQHNKPGRNRAFKNSDTYFPKTFTHR